MARLVWAGTVLVVIVILSAVLSGCIQRPEQQSNSTQSDEMTLRDSFPDGRPELRWAFFPYFNLDNLEGKRDNNAPDGDNGIGALSNANAGGFASLSYAVTGEVNNFYLEAMIYCPVTEGDTGQLSGIAFLINPVEGNFYRFVCDFKSSDPTLNIAYVGLDTRNFPVYLKFWDPGGIPGGVPKEEGWHKMAVRVKDGKATAYWNGNELEGSPVNVDKIPGGFVGVYTNYVGGLGNATTKVDSFILKVE
ncbi:hypothetical protein ANME2D_01808 [Candidatus Methanoperedens nitroreducens]|uniref:3-keto-disaccharide hydrolase domain-containing protein n=1 Tax=Candidatus Methanoperedens nitratireducens TaxID=1392998 RepID=A0A062V7K3_9EURY|nr:hypothetical protein [Candidatus Methanoperedens nitroreducens]KCZ71754.1 hypothetical protein ANME2D_01808 [Candidatus Methanoperedens nitroreducens]MDJ1422273.1 hypothetical protein [Candidatus Methanoperedens sp.]